MKAQKGVDIIKLANSSPDKQTRITVYENALHGKIVVDEAALRKQVKDDFLCSTCHLSGKPCRPINPDCAALLFVKKLLGKCIHAAKDEQPRLSKADRIFYEGRE